MTIADLIEIKRNTPFVGEKALKCELIALDGKTGKILFDTSRNKREQIEKYFDGEVIALWADVKLQKGIAYGDYILPVMKCYVSHNSWEKHTKGESE